MTRHVIAPTVRERREQTIRKENLRGVNDVHDLGARRTIHDNVAHALAVLADTSTFIVGDRCLGDSRRRWLAAPVLVVSEAHFLREYEIGRRHASRQRAAPLPLQVATNQ